MILTGSRLVGFWISDEWKFERDGDEVAVPGTVVEVVRIEDDTGDHVFVGQVLDAETQMPVGEACRTGAKRRIRRWWLEKAPGAPLPDELSHARAFTFGPRDRVDPDQT